MPISRSRFTRVANLLMAALFLVVAGVVQTAAAANDDPKSAAAVAQKPPDQTIHRLLREAAQIIEKPPATPFRAYDLLEIAHAQLRAGDKEGALETAQLASAAAVALEPKTPWGARVAVAWIRGAAGDRVGALNELRQTRDSAAELAEISNQMWALKAIACSQADLGDRDAAMITIEIMSDIALAIPEKRNDRLFPLQELVFARIYVGDIKGAFLTVEAGGAGDHYLQGHLFGEMAQAAAATSPFYLQPRKVLGPEQRKASRELIGRIEKAVAAFEFAEGKPYVTMAIALAHLGDFEGALRLARRIGKDPSRVRNAIGVPATPYALSVIAGEQAKAGHRDEARKTLREALDLIARDPKLSMRLSQIALGQAKAGDFAGALKTVESVAAEERGQLLKEVAELQDKSGDHEGARATYRIALADAEKRIKMPAPPPRRLGVGKEPAPPANAKAVPPETLDPAIQWRDGCHAEIAATQAKLGALQAAVEAMNSIRLENFKGWAAQDIAQARARAGDIEGALAWASTLEPPSVRSWAIRGLATGTLPR